MEWPTTPAELEQKQRELGALIPTAWEPGPGHLAIGGCFVCFQRGVSGAGAAGEPAWAAAVVMIGSRVEAQAVVEGVAGASYEAGLLALREGPLLESAVRALPTLPDVLLVDATGRDHPRRCGLAFQLGAVLAMPTVGVTHRPLCAGGAWPVDELGAAAPLTLDDSVVGFWVVSKQGTRPLAVHAAWRTSPEVARDVFLRAVAGARTPEPLRRARQLARQARHAATSGGKGDRSDPT
jgi:deoxyribonuclease V